MRRRWRRRMRRRRRGRRGKGATRRRVLMAVLPACHVTSWCPMVGMANARAPLPAPRAPGWRPSWRPRASRSAARVSRTRCKAKAPAVVAPLHSPTRAVGVGARATRLELQGAHTRLLHRRRQRRCLCLGRRQACSTARLHFYRSRTASARQPCRRRSLLLLQQLRILTRATSSSSRRRAKLWTASSIRLAAAAAPGARRAAGRGRQVRTMTCVTPRTSPRLPRPLSRPRCATGALRARKARCGDKWRRRWREQRLPCGKKRRL